MKTLTQQAVLTKFRKAHGTFFDYSKVVYVNQATHVTIICPDHGEYNQRPKAHWLGHKCKKCSGFEVCDVDSFIIAATKIHGDRYSYQSVEYTGMLQDVTIRCNIHGAFTQSCGNHLAGQNCPECANINRLSAVVYTTEQFIEKANIKHHAYYSYLAAIYRGARKTITITCPHHGQFNQLASAHLSGKGCIQCSYINRSISRRKSTEQFIDESREVHGDYYGYQLVHYEGNSVHVSVVCPKHGTFIQVPSSHLSGCGCPRCTTRVSKGCKTWLDSLGLPDDSEHREVRGLLGRYIVDGYDSSTNTIYEFQGSFWHGELNHPKFPHDAINPITKTTFGELYDQTLAKKNAFEVAGFNYVEIWESEWN